MSFAIRMQKTASKLLNKFDERTVKIKLLQQGAKTFNETAAEYDIGASVEVDLTGVAVPFAENLVDGSTIQSGDVKLTITHDTKPTLKDKIILDGDNYSIVSISPFNYTGDDLTIAYSLQVRK